MMDIQHPPVRCATLFYNRRRDEAYPVMLRAAEQLRLSGVEALLCSDSDLPAQPFVRRVTMDEAMEHSDMAIVIGGDGSILRVAASAAPRDIPILAVNMGHLGFMSELEPTELTQIPPIMQGRYRIDRRMMLEASIVCPGSNVSLGHVLNDVVINRSHSGRILDLDVYADDEHVLHLHADGVIVATPTGSTAYSLSAGGPIIEPAAEAIVITPICAHGLYAKSLVFSHKRRILLCVRHEAQLSLDGQELIALPQGDTIAVTRSPYVTSLARIYNKSVFDVIRNKLTYPARPGI
ncbi:MAG: NAD(+)/NADH kinase [Ruminococcaceae bacterium]|nr:NAD(+)/NADH kinase [Oscillospiraceae bacterium]